MVHVLESQLPVLPRGSEPPALPCPSGAGMGLGRNSGEGAVLEGGTPQLSLQPCGGGAVKGRAGWADRSAVVHQTSRVSPHASPHVLASAALEAFVLPGVLRVP